jgi:hypothetical protein
MFLSHVHAIFPLYNILIPAFTPISLRFDYVTSPSLVRNNAMVQVPYRQANGRSAQVKTSFFFFSEGESSLLCLYEMPLAAILSHVNSMGILMPYFCPLLPTLHKLWELVHA